MLEFSVYGKVLFQTFIKRVVRKEKYVVLMSDNPDRVKYEDIIVPTDEYSDLVCRGIVIE